MKTFGEGFQQPIDENGAPVPGSAHIALTGNGYGKTGVVVLPPMEDTSLSGRPSKPPLDDQPRVPAASPYG